MCYYANIKLAHPSLHATAVNCVPVNRGGLPVTLTIRRFMIVLVLATLLAACTRERPMPEPTATSAVADSAGGADSADAAGSGAGEGDTPSAAAPAGEPQVATATPAPEDVELTVTNTPDTTATPGSPETFQYVVRAGDTLATIAQRFETDIETLRRLNNLSSDVLIVGQPLYVPYVEGMTAEGMPTPTPGPFEYTIQAGDTLSGIAARFGVDPIQIIERNNLLSPDNLTVGITIIIPGYQPPAGEGATEGTAGEDGAPAPDQGIVHVVQAGEGLVGIATQYGVTVDEIVAANNLVDPNTLRVGQELIIPGVTEREAAAAQGQIHVVAAGESLLGIAVRYGVTVEEIMEINELADPNSLFVGQELIIPSP